MYPSPVVMSIWMSFEIWTYEILSVLICVQLIINFEPGEHGWICIIRERLLAGHDGW
jgi:hypothetical protein